jgi:hypothetical protein
LYGRWYALGPAGNVLWSLPIAGQPTLPPAIAPDGTVYVSGGGSPVLHAIVGTSGLSSASPWPKFMHDAKNTGRAH